MKVIKLNNEITKIIVKKTNFIFGNFSKSFSNKNPTIHPTMTAKSKSIINPDREKVLQIGEEGIITPGGRGSVPC
jgi:hypothetical protein